MNAPLRTPVVSEEARERYAKLVADFLSLANTQRRLAHRYKRLALEAEKLGRLESYRHSKAEATRLWTDAKWHIARARIHMERTTP